jgi:hypothetical protein
VSDPRVRLRELAADCRVRIGTDIAGAPDEGGSGVWIAPGTVLTCAHVVPAGPNSKVQVGWREQIHTGTVSDQIPDTPADGLWPYPDLAVIVVENAPQHPCAWLSEAAPVRDLIAFGHSAALGEGLQPAEVVGWRGGSHVYGEGLFWQFKGNELVSGMSGGPVLDLASSAVCGIVSVSLGEGADRGGYVVPIEGLRCLGVQRRRDLLIAHDRFHGRDRVWAALRAELPPSPGSPRYPVTPSEEVQLLGLLAQFPAADPGELLTLLARNSVDGRMPAPPAALRDVAYALLDSGGPDQALLMSVLRMTNDLVGDFSKPDHLDLYNWATALAARHELLTELSTLRQTPALDDTRGGVISVEIVPGTARVDRFRLTVSVQEHQRGRRPIYQDQDPVHTLDQVMQKACDQLRIALPWLAGNAQVEFVVPIELFDEPFDELAPTKPYTNLGRKYRVVLRDYDRQFDALTQHDWRKRWQHIQNPSGGIRWITCNEDLTLDEFSAELEQHPEVAVVALTRSPSSSGQVSDMLRVALDSGMPVAVWRRDTCPEHDHNVIGPACSGQRFREAFNPLLAVPAISDLPESVRQLRNKAAGKSPAPADREGQGTVLLWDDPVRMRQPVAPVHEPPYEPLENSNDQ